MEDVYGTLERRKIELKKEIEVAEGAFKIADIRLRGLRNEYDDMMAATKAMKYWPPELARAEDIEEEAHGG